MKEEILQTSLQQFLRYGIREMTIQKLIAPLGISTKTVYKYFKNKEELLKEALFLYYAQRFQMLEDMSDNQDAIPLLLNIWYIALKRETEVKEVFFQDLHDYYPELENMIDAVKSDKFFKQFIKIIHKGMNEAVMRKDILPEVVFEGISVLYTAFIRKGQYNTFGISPYEMMLNTIAMYLRGFCTHKGILELEKHIRTINTTGKDTVLIEKIYAI